MLFGLKNIVEIIKLFGINKIRMKELNIYTKILLCLYHDVIGVEVQIKLKFHI